MWVECRLLPLPSGYTFEKFGDVLLEWLLCALGYCAAHVFAAWGAGERLACMQAAATAGLGLMFGLELCIRMCCRFDCFMPCGSSTCCVCGGMGYG